MDPTSAVRTDALPAFGTMVIPGGIVAAPFAYLILSRFPMAAAYFDKHDAAAVAVAVLLAVTFGLVIESMGSYVEALIIDRLHPNPAEMLKRWWLYLRIQWGEKEPIGQKYLRGRLTIFKFELNVGVALLLAAVCLKLSGGYGELTEDRATVASIAVALFGVGALVAASQSSLLLASIRDQLLKGVGLPPFDEDGNPSKPPAERKPMVWRQR